MLRWKSLLSAGLPKGERRRDRKLKANTRRLAVETLEDRRMLAAVSVSNVSEMVDGTVSSIGALISNPGTDGTISLREAILAANATAGADEITFDSIVFARAQTIMVGSQLPTISDSVTITGPTAGGVTLDADGGNYRIFLIDDADANNLIDVELQNLTLTGANLTNIGDLGGVGGGILSRESLTILDSTLSGNSASFGGGIHNYEGNLTIINSTLSGNSASFDVGGAISNFGSATIDISTITNNSATMGGGIFQEIGFSTTISNSIVAGNIGSDITDASGSLSGSFNLIGDGTGLTGITNGVDGNMVGTDTNPIDPLLEPLADNGGPTLTHALQPTSPAIDMGDLAFTTPPDFDQRGTGFDRIVNGRIDIGAFEVQIDPSLFIVTTLEDEQTDNGFVSLREAIANANNTVGSQEITFAPALTSGGAATINIASQLPAITDALTITGPGANLLSIDAGLGGDGLMNGNGYRIFIIDDGTDSLIDVEISGLTFTGGDTTADGGAIFNRENLTLTESTLSGNSASGSGGGVYNFMSGIVTITQSTLSGNEATLMGGGVSNTGTATITQSTLSGNSANGGGGVFNNFFAIATITESTLSGNSATSGSGGGVLNVFSTAQITQSIISGNTAVSGREISNQSGMVTLDGFNLLGDNSKSTAQALSEVTAGTSDILATSDAADVPLASILSPLANNGGPTQTHALVADSPAIDAGDPAFSTPPDFDQRGAGFPRVLDGNGDSVARVDIGAFEFPAAPPTPKTVSLDSSQNLVITDLVTGGADDRIGLSVVGPNLVIVNPSQPMTSDISGASNNGPNELLVPLSAIVGGKVIVNSLEGDDTLSVKTSVTTAGLDVEFDGGTGSDGLAVMGTGTEIASYTTDASTTGDGVIDVGGKGINFANLEPVDISGMMSAQLNLPGANDVLTVAEGVDFVSGGTNQALRVSGTSGGVAIESAAFWDNQTLSINTASGTDGDDTITIQSAANTHLNQSLSLKTGVGNDNVNLNGPAHFSMIAEIESHNISLAGKFSATDYVELIASGAIVDAADNSDIKIEAQAVVLEAGEGIGTTANAIEAATQELFTLNTISGTIHVVNLGALELTGLEAVGAAIIEASSPLTISGNVTVGADSTFTASDSPATGDDLTILSGVTVDANGSNLTFNAGDDFVFASGASIVDAANVIVNVDTPDADAPDVGSSVSFLGTITALLLSINGGEEEDTFVVIPSVNTPMQINGGPPTTTPGDRLIVAQLGGIADAVVPAGPPTSGTISFSAGSHQAITYTSIESLLAGTFVVDTLDDEDDGDFSVGDLSLREAIGLANGDSGPDTITFDPALNGGTIVLDMGELFITDELNITGPGATLLTIDADELSRIFNIDDGGSANDFDVTIAGLTLTGGRTTANNMGSGDSTHHGGAIRSLTTGNLSINDSTISGNSTGGDYAFGGGIYAKNLTLTNSTVSGNNTAGGHAPGGGITAYYNVTLLNSTVSGNSTTGANAPGGGIYSYNLALTNSTVSGNSTLETNSHGGGIAALFATLTNSTVSGNSTSGSGSRGGGLYAYIATLTNSTVSGNSTTGNFADGGGIIAYTADLNHSTITDNHVSHVLSVGGGVYVELDLTSFHTIVADNTAGGGNPDLRTGVGTLSVDYSLIGDTSGTGITIATGVGNLLNIPAELFALADNGGPTLTHIPMPTSPVIDAGNPAIFAGVGGVPEFDQRGESFPRVRDGNGDLISRIDIGATEVENQINGPQVIGLEISDTVDTADVFVLNGPTLVGRELVIRVRDLPPRSNVADAPALDFAFASNQALYTLIGDHTGNIAIASVQVDQDPITPGQPATASIRLIFAEPLPDDRFTLTMSDSVRDPDGNRLDGESNAAGSPSPAFPSGDGVPGGNFVARFTVDSRPELGVFGAGQVIIDANGNYLFDPNNADPISRDSVFLLGNSTDSIFAGKFVEGASDTVDGFDKLAVYGRAGNQWQWQIDFNNDGIPDLKKNEPLNINGIPFAGNFDGNSENGDEVGVFTGTTWYFDTDHDFQLDASSAVTIANLTGYPVVGDFDGNGFEDLATYNPSAGNNIFSIATGTAFNSWSSVLVTSRVGAAGSSNGFAGVRERPVVGDMNADGLDDLGLWVPEGAQLVTGQPAEWYFLVSGDNPLTIATETNLIERFKVGGGFVTFSTAPFGNDIFAQFGNSYMLPVVGNFYSASASQTSSATAQFTATEPVGTPTEVEQVIKANIVLESVAKSVEISPQSVKPIGASSDQESTRARFLNRRKPIDEPAITITMPPQAPTIPQPMTTQVEPSSFQIEFEQQIASVVLTPVAVFESNAPEIDGNQADKEQASAGNPVLSEVNNVLNLKEIAPEHSSLNLPSDKPVVFAEVNRIESPTKESEETPPPFVDKPLPGATIMRSQALRAANLRIPTAKNMFETTSGSDKLPLIEIEQPALEIPEEKSVLVSPVIETENVKKAADITQEPMVTKVIPASKTLSRRISLFGSLAKEIITGSKISGPTPVAEANKNEPTEKLEAELANSSGMSADITKKVISAIDVQSRGESAIQAQTTEHSVSVKLTSLRKSFSSNNGSLANRTQLVYIANSVPQNRGLKEETKIMALDSAFADLSSLREEPASGLAVQWAEMHREELFTNHDVEADSAAVIEGEIAEVHDSERPGSTMRFFTRTW